ncbi:NB-ARC domain-containing protein [Streptomyces sp. NBC_00481]|uniref:AfsR/SARP family transcriptional regulator n=1 Tax=unclassified Streptomyces TaxID=2593676 RepID=UPI002DDB71AB|nr:MULTISPECIES: BTAD domain-containing putative transcriptional regulator [unclassified Streptomyces]WRZ01117.1 NB-ARC domain-containing protein [Streptomyces sp. NBC_00481]
MPTHTGNSPQPCGHPLAETDDTGRDISFGILGPLQVVIDGKPIRMGRNRQRTVLAVLLLNANKIVPVGSLVDAVWCSEPPATADKQIQTCIWRLRNAFAAAGAPAGLIDTAQGGYRMRLTDEDLDVHIFETTVRQAREQAAAGDLESAMARYQSALSLFRGKPLADLTGPLAYSVAAHWDERRFTVLEEWLDVSLALGRHAELISELKPLVAEYPMRERLCAQLMTALYLSQRRAEALAVYRNSRTTLINKLGLEPGARLQEVHQQILAGEPVAPPPTAPRRTPRPGRPPAQLPARISDFTGRHDLIHRITRDLRAVGGPRVVSLAGCGGSGKTALAVHAGHSVEEHFPDGQLYADLRGQSEPVPPQEALRGFLDALGVPEHRIPAGLAARAALFRSTTAGKRLLIVLDDIAESTRYEALLPSGESAVLCTGRASLLKIPGLIEYRVDGLPAEEALDLLASVAGVERVLAEADSARQITELCGRLPLAIRAAGARLRTRPHGTLSSFVDRLEDRHNRTAELSIGSLDVGARLASTLDQLSPAGYQLWLRLSQCDLEAVPERTASALSGRPAEDTQRMLDTLVNQHLLTVAPGDAADGPTYGFNPLVRDYAWQRAEAELGPAARGTADRIARPLRPGQLSAAGTGRHHPNGKSRSYGSQVV